MDKHPIDQLIEALGILKKYLPKDAYPTHCEHDVLAVMVPYDADIDPADAEKLGELGFHADEECGHWASFRFGSA
jgi:hypothetical protein